MRSLRRSMAPLLRAAAVHRLLPHHNLLFTSCRSTSTFLRTPSPSANESSALSCSGCGVSLQSSDATSLGYYKQPVKQPETAANSVEVPEDGRKWAPPLAVICQRCHRAKHYGNLVPVTLPYKAFEATLRSIARRPDACLLVVLDVLDVHSSMLAELAACPRSRLLEDVIFCANKCDVLPPDALTHSTRLQTYVRTELARLGLPKGLNLHLISSKTGHGVRDMMTHLKEIAKARDVYVVGAANVGKSTLVNRLVCYAHGTTPERAVGGKIEPMPPRAQDVDDEDNRGEDDDDAPLGLPAPKKPHRKEKEQDPKAAAHRAAAEEGEEDEEEALSSPFSSAVVFDSANRPKESSAVVSHLPPFVTSSPLPGTTVAIVCIPFLGSTRLHDTPGIVIHDKKQELFERLAADGGASAITQAMLLKRKAPPTYRLSPGRSLFLGGLARVDLSNDTDPFDNVLFTWFGSLPVHATSTERAGEVWEKHKGRLLSPYAGELSTTETFSLKDLNITFTAGEGQEYNTKRNVNRKMQRTRKSVVDIVFSGFGWLSITPIPVVGSWQWEKTMQRAVITVTTHTGVPTLLRQPLLPFQTLGTTPNDWKT